MTSLLMMYKSFLWQQITKGVGQNLEGDCIIWVNCDCHPALEEVRKVKRSGRFSIWKMLIHKESKEHLASVARLYKIRFAIDISKLAKQWF